MPAHITHSIFGNEILNGQFAEDDKNGYTVCGYKIDKAAYEWALQGPDILFFAVLAKHKELPAYGSIMHHSKTDELFLAMQQYAISVKDTADFKVVFSYICGFSCHYILDKNCHPYVYYLQEKRTKEKPKLHSIHNKIESDIDCAMAYCKFGMAARQFKIPDVLLDDQTVYLPIAKLYQYLLKNIYDIMITTDGFYACFNGSKRYFNLIIDKAGLGLAAKIIDFITHQKGKVYSLLRVKRYDSTVMNYEHHEWYNLQMPEIKKTQSFDELYDFSKHEAGQMIKKIASLMLNASPRPVTYGDTFDNGSPKINGKKPSEDL